jgi:hypothetical protein
MTEALPSTTMRVPQSVSQLGDKLNLPVFVRSSMPRRSEKTLHSECHCHQKHWQSSFPSQLGRRPLGLRPSLTIHQTILLSRGWRQLCVLW